jgi:3'-phosphoadenosine 5'-phosphosulfate sulfotransferase (PAPS reductase)/FAD synthetase
VSFSGGKDSTVLLHIVRSLYPDIEAVFVNTGLEYPEIQQFVKTFDNVTILRPKMRFDEVIKKYGYPIISKEVAENIEQGRKSLEKNDGTYTYRLRKLYGTNVDKNGNPSIFNCTKYEPLLHTDFITSNKCCGVMKKSPVKEYAKKTGKVPITAQMAEESKLRRQQWLKNGCNGFDMKSPVSNPMSFWTEQDVLLYIKRYSIPIAPVYGEVVYKDDPDQMRLGDYLEEYAYADMLATTGCNRTGCIFCAFGCHLEKAPSRFQRLKETHPRQYEYCINGGEWDEDGVWKPNKEGLGMGHVFDELNKIYGDGFIKYQGAEK